MQQESSPCELNSSNTGHCSLCCTPVLGISPETTHVMQVPEDAVCPVTHCRFRDRCFLLDDTHLASVFEWTGHLLPPGCLSFLSYIMYSLLRRMSQSSSQSFLPRIVLNRLALYCKLLLPCVSISRFVHACEVLPSRVGESSTSEVSIVKAFSYLLHKFAHYSYF